MQKMFLTALFAGAITLTAFSAQAFPGAMPAPVSTQTDVIQVAGGCGPGWHRGPYGGCRRNWRPLPGYGKRCWFRPTPYGPRRVCRWR